MGRSIKWGITALVGLSLVGCHLDDFLKVPSPAGVASASDLASQSGAEAVYYESRATLYNAIYGSWTNAVYPWMGFLSDEFQFAGYAWDGYYAGVDARRTIFHADYSTGYESGDQGWSSLLAARSDLVDALPGLKSFEPASSRSNIGEAYAMLGYSEIFLAEGYCGGTPLSQVNPNGGIEFGKPITDDSMLGVAQADFDSAIANAGGADSTLNLARVGLARVLVDRGQLAAAADTVASVPVGFVYNTELASNYGPSNYVNMYAIDILGPYNAVINVADSKGENGLNFISAHDPRLTYDTSYQTLDGSFGGNGPQTLYMPTKFSSNLTYIPMASGLEAALIQAEAALAAHDNVTWLADLNTLRTSGFSVADTGVAPHTAPDTTWVMGTGQVAGQTAGLPLLQDPGSDSARLSLMFRERAFWLFGTGTRLGDLRRLVRQYGRDQSVVYPTGPYLNGSNPHLPAPILTYGTDVVLTIPTLLWMQANGEAQSNPNYKSCITPTTTA